VEEKRRAAQVAAAAAAATEGGRGAAFRSTSNPGTGAAVSGSLNTTGLSAEEDITLQGEGANVTPPDTTGAIGPSDYVEAVNNEIAVYARTDLSLIGSPEDLATFTKGIEPCDPQIKYDSATERWFYVAIRCDGTKTLNQLYLGFSKTSDPTDLSTASEHGWCGYEYSFGAAFEDYPKLGLDAQHIVIGTNSFSTTSEALLTAHVFSLPKPVGEITTCPVAPALSSFGSEGTPLKTTVLGHKASTPEPATVADGSKNGYVVAADEATPFSGKGKNIMIWQVAGTATAPTLEALGAPVVSEFALPPNVPQPGSTDELDSLDSRLTQAVTAPDPTAGNADAVWTQHTVAGGAGTVVRWYELLPGTVAVKQAGTISDPSKVVFNGAIAPTLNGGAVIDYNAGGKTALVQMMAQSRIASAPAGTMGSPALLASSSAIDADFSCPSQPLGEFFEASSCRWGDYAGASVDPINGNLVWGSNQVNGAIGPDSEFGHNAQWQTSNFALTNDVAPVASFTASPNPGTAASSVGFNGTGSSDVDGTVVSYRWDFGDGSAAGSGATPSHVYVAAGGYTVTLTVSDNEGLAGSVSQSVTINAAATGVPAALGTAPAPTAPVLALAPTPNSNFSPLRATFNIKTGVITLTGSVGDPGTFKWLLTFQNGKFGVFAASTAKCKQGFVRLKGKCRPSAIMYAKGSKLLAAPGTVTFTAKPSRSALKALRNALRQKKGLRVSIRLTFQSSRGGSAVSHTQSLTVRLKTK
jgi:PKD repeat protein